MESTPKNNCSSDQQTITVSSKLIPVFDDPKIAAHLYLPESKPNDKLPILVYVHGGAFRRDPRSLSAESHALVVSVDYKPATEHYPSETAYDVCFTTLQWVASHRSGHEKEPWLLVYGDFGRVSIGGDSPDRNMIHKLAKRAGYEVLFNKDWVSIGSIKFAMVCRRAGHLGHFMPRSQRASGFTYVLLNAKLYRECICIVPVIKAALLRQLGTSSSVHKNINESEMERYSLELCKGVRVTTYLKLRSLHSMNHQTMFKYARKPNLQSLFEVPIPYAFAISQLGFFEVTIFN
ncbi:2-hydroxyisoflavanone dehydratase [Linum perenne]